MKSAIRSLEFMVKRQFPGLKIKNGLARRDGQERARGSSLNYMVHNVVSALGPVQRWSPKMVHAVLFYIIALPLIAFFMPLDVGF